VRRSTASRANSFQSRSRPPIDFEASPAGTVTTAVVTPAAVREATAAVAWEPATPASAITTLRRPPAAMTAAPMPPSVPAPTTMS